MTEPPPERCPHHAHTGRPCGGPVLPTGHCGRCGRHRDLDEERHGADRPPAGTGPRRAGGATRHALLPTVPRPAGEHATLDDERPPRLGLYCRHCGTSFRWPYTRRGRLPLRGHCPWCGEPYDFSPRLDQVEERVGGKYAVLGCIGHGGHGWVYLARDTHLDEFVAIKGLLHRHGGPGTDPRDRATAERERGNLVAIRHESIVQVRDYLAGEGDAPGYIVMEYLGDLTLQAVIDGTRAGRRPLGVPLDIEHVLAYGSGILDALIHLHGRGYAHLDIKPSNVIHHEDRVKVIDLGGARRFEDPELPHRTPRYAGPGPAGRPTDALDDQYGVGMTLRDLYPWALSADLDGTAAPESFRLLTARATRTDPARRFTDAREMRGQLRGVLREVRALRGQGDPAEPSRYFVPPLRLLGDRLGAVPAPAHWTTRPLTSRDALFTAPAIDPGTPTPLETACRLPVPRPYENDPQAPLFDVSGYSPEAELPPVEKGEPSVEVLLHNVRSSLARRDPESAGRHLRRAEGVDGPYGARAWRLHWHRGLVALAEAGEEDGGGRSGACLARAGEEFGAVLADLPGEYAPKLALAHCAEQSGDRSSARRYYEAVLARNPQHCGAALGLARLAVADGDRQQAVTQLGRVAPGSLDAVTAEIAAVRVRAARLPGVPGAEPGLTQIEAASAALDRIGKLQAGERELLRTELREWELDALVRTAARTPAVPDGTTARIRELRQQLAENYRTMAAAFPDRRSYEHLIDLSHIVRPATRT